MRLVHRISLSATMGTCCAAAVAAVAAPPAWDGGVAAIDRPGPRTIPARAWIAAADSASDQSASTATADLRVEQGRLVSGPTVLRVKQGDRVVLRVTSDKADELHLHGYDLHLALTPGKTAELDFRAGRTGRFTYELHHQELELGAVEVYPR